MSFCEINLEAFNRATGEKPVFKPSTSRESDDSEVTNNSTMRMTTVIELGKVSYLCDEMPFVRHMSNLGRSTRRQHANSTTVHFEAFEVFHCGAASDLRHA